MDQFESSYRSYLQNTRNLVVTFFERPEQFPAALQSVRHQIESTGVEPDRSCILYRTLCDKDALPRLRVWSHPVAFELLDLPTIPHAWLGLDRDRKRPMTDQECRAFLLNKLYDVLELRVSRRDQAARSR